MEQYARKRVYLGLGIIILSPLIAALLSGMFFHSSTFEPVIAITLPIAILGLAQVIIGCIEVIVFELKPSSKKE